MGNLSPDSGYKAYFLNCIPVRDAFLDSLTCLCDFPSDEAGSLPSPFSDGQAGSLNLLLSAGDEVYAKEFAVRKSAIRTVFIKTPCFKMVLIFIGALYL